jgi:hypothetical protein
MLLPIDMLCQQDRAKLAEAGPLGDGQIGLRR